MNPSYSLVEAGPRVKAGDELPWVVEEDRLKTHHGQQVPTADAAALTPITKLQERPGRAFLLKVGRRTGLAVHAGTVRSRPAG